ncbi:MAG: hypothetical protein ACXACP_05670 [Candidatus Hodarchaeales archaeon]
MTLKMCSHVTSSKYKNLMKITLICLTAISLFAFNVVLAEFDPSTIVISLREHKSRDIRTPNWSWSKPSSSTCRMTSTTSGLGNGYMFFTVNRDFIQGKYFRIRWQAQNTWEDWSNRIYIMDGSYDRANDLDFPLQYHPLDKGNGRLQIALWHRGSFSWITEEFQVDVSGGSQDTVTIFIRSRDAWEAQSGWLQLDLLEIDTGAGGSGTLWRTHFLDSVHMEKTGSTGDYGYITPLLIPPYLVIPEFPLGTISAIAAGVLALLIAGKRPLYFRRKKFIPFTIERVKNAIKE